MTKIIPLADGRVSIKDQANKLGLDLPIGKTVAEVRSLGFDTDPDWPDHAIIKINDDSPTGLVVWWPWDGNSTVFMMAN